MDIKKLIQENRKIKEITLNSYLISLKKLNDNQEIKDLNFLKDYDKIIKILDTKKLTTKRNYLTSVLVVLSAFDKEEFNEVLKKYRLLLDELTKQLNKQYQENQKNQKENKNWTNLRTLKKVMRNNLKEIEERDLKNKETLTKKENELIKLTLIGLLYTELIPKRLDYAPMTIIKSRNDIKPNINYLLNLGRNKKYFIIQEYKTSNRYGLKEILIPKKINTLLNIYLKFHNQDSFLLDSKGKPLTSNGLGKLIPKAFEKIGKNITVNLIRHIWVTENCDIEKIKKNKELSKEMCHSLNTQENYFKK